jgi:hypothetical protein
MIGAQYHFLKRFDDASGGATLCGDRFDLVYWDYSHLWNRDNSSADFYVSISYNGYYGTGIDWDKDLTQKSPVQPSETDNAIEIYGFTILYRLFCLNY